jgi:methionyl aminopeptidase
MREACRIAAQVLDHMKGLAQPGISTWDLDEAARKCMEALGARSACFGYAGPKGRFPAHTCISINEEVIHGIGSPKRRLVEGDIVKLDVVVQRRGFIGDNAATVAIGTVSPEKKRLIEVTQEALRRAISAARPGNRVGDVSAAMQRHAEGNGFSVVRQFVGHGVGLEMHEEPQVPCFGKAGTGPVLKPGMTLAIEPMVNSGTHDVDILDDGWTAVTGDRRPSAHFEHTVLITADGNEILTLS